MSGDLRDDLAKALEKVETGEDTAAKPAAASESKEPAADSVQSQEPAAKTGEEKKEPVEEPKQEPAQGKKEPAPTTPTQEPAARPPVSWKPEARETWAKLDPVAQGEILRREREIDQTLKQTVEARRVAEDLNKAAAPYAHILAAENSTPMQAFANLMQTGAILRVGSPLQKAQLAADMIVRFGIDIEQLDQHIAARIQGQQPRSAPNPEVQHLQQQFAPALEFINGLKQQQQQFSQRQQQETEQTIQQFAEDPKNEFFHDVKEDMAFLLETYARRGQKLSLQDAYAKATMAHPTISQIVEQRRLTASAQQQNAAAQRAATAGASLSSRQAPSSDGKEADPGDTIRSAIEAAMGSAGKRV